MSPAANIVHLFDKHQTRHMKNKEGLFINPENPLFLLFFSGAYYKSGYGLDQSEERMVKAERSCGTHNGTFHADEVTACALLLLFNLIDRDKIFRTRDLDLLDRCEYVCDVGGIYDPIQKRFDHHQKEYGGSLSSAGMILSYLAGTDRLAQNEADFLYNSMICGVDAIDNGYDPKLPGFCLFSDVIGNFAPINYDASQVEYDTAFFLAVDFTTGHLRRMLARFRYHESCKDQVKETMGQQSEWLLFTSSIPWMDSFFQLDGEHHPAKFIIMPVGNQWKLRGIPPNGEERMKVRVPLPEVWAGRSEQELKKITGIEGAVFCHKGRFISIWETKEAAMQALEQVLPNSTKKDTL